MRCVPYLDPRIDPRMPGDGVVECLAVNIISPSSSSHRGDGVEGQDVQTVPFFSLDITIHEQK